MQNLMEGKERKTSIYFRINGQVNGYIMCWILADCIFFLVPKLKYKKRRLPRCIHHFNSDLINNMDHMRISGNEPSSVILRQTMRFQK